MPEGAHLVPLWPKRRKTGPELGSPEETYRFMREAYSSPVERFYVLLLDNRNRVTGAVVVSQGTLTSADVHPRETFAPAIQARAAAVILAHNHPSGTPSPSDADIEVTARLIKAGGVVGIPVLDHVIIGDGGFTSLRQQFPEMWRHAQHPAAANPARSPRQRRLFGAALAFKRGELRDAGPDVRRLAATLPEETLREFARSL